MEPLLLKDDEIINKLDLLNKDSKNAWRVTGNVLSKEFLFDDFNLAFRFMTLCAAEAELMNHHPQWCNNYNSVLVNLTTHAKNGITHLDFELAQIMDMLALTV